MAVVPTGAIYKSLFFDGEDSRDYGVYITGQAVYNAPEREVEMVSIPGRSGALALDRGRFENIEVTYPAGIYANNEADFAEAISDFRNLLCSRRGYVRLQDEYNPNEYRMAIYKSGLEVEPATLRAGEFEIIFDCKPQRWLTSGEDAITVNSGDVVSNPTLFESSPLLEVDGYGTMEFNGYQISLSGEDLGSITTNNRINYGGFRENADSSVLVDFQYANAGDSIFVDVDLSFEVRCNPYTFSNVNVTKMGSLPTPSYLVEGGLLAIYLGNKLYGEPSYEFHYGTASSYSGTVTATGTANGTSFTAQTAITISYDGADTIRIQANCTSSLGIVTAKADVATNGPVTYYSTQSTLGNPLYIDCEIGEAYKIEGGTPVSINSGITLGSDLPKLSSGANTFTFDNTIAELKVVPRWWKI